MKKFDLNIEKILENWDVCHAIREVIANALDEQALTKSKDVEISKDKAGRWHIRDYGRGLKYQHLTQKENQEKLLLPDLVIGKFGIGLKDALATLDRHKIHVLIHSKHGSITIAKSSKHGFDDITTLHAVITEPSDPAMRGTDVIFERVKDGDMAAAKDFFLRFSGDKPLETTAYGQVLDKGKSAIARIYITGLCVAQEENFLCSYNITSVNASIRKALNRERANVGRTAYSERVKDILLDCKQPQVGQLLVNDLKKYEAGKLHDELAWLQVQVHACKLLNTKRDVIFVTPAELIDAKDLVDHAMKDGHQVTIIPESLKEKIRDETDYQGNPIRDLGTYTREWNASFEFQFIEEEDLTKKELEIFRQTNAIFDLIGGKPRVVRQVVISATMRTEAFNHREAAGIWEAGKQRIIIKRDQLKDLRSYAGTLLHETAHATSGATDLTREFETELTEFLGKIAQKNRLV